MIAETEKAALLDAFRGYLDSLDGEEGPEPAEATDLYSLFAELAALRTEVKTESRQVGAALEQFKEAFGLLGQAHGRLEQALDDARQALARARREALKPLLLEILDCHDRLAAGQAALASHRSVRGWFGVKSCKQDLAFIQGVREGQGMTLRRLEEALARQHVRPLEVLGRPVDPHTMAVVELDSQPGVDGGVVTAELRKGFLWGDEILRLAEVKANKP